MTDQTGRGEVESDPDLAAERRLLIDLLIYAWDRARSPGVWERLTVGLEQVGVEVIRPDGQPFDPSSHEVGGVEPTSDPARHNTVAETETVGFRDRGRLVREPVVVVFRSG
ncbi:GrpE protein [Nakamurella panacisegetis]|uniref:GrpE protein n=1 Tax=Nakamurella panacisegetis TaxID=1090615 RepID=A0A1H0MC89_9ACTN|nr:nucleotide exchange factor GrpE [Nakamurella panacisegetis]SDO77921.1 GrpE protein [Nakamurella panacisegetis]